MDDQMDDQINFDKAFADMAEQVAVMNRECNRLQAALDRAEADKVRAVEAERERCAVICEEQAQLVGHTLYCTEFCCCSCVGLVIQKGITRVVVPRLNPSSSWYGNYLEARELLRETKVEIAYEDTLGRMIV
jgi:deoxycytidylate deaminase